MGLTRKRGGGFKAAASCIVDRRQARHVLIKVVQEFYFPSVKFVMTSTETDAILSGRSVLDLFFFSAVARHGHICYITKTINDLLVHQSES